MIDSTLEPEGLGHSFRNAGFRNVFASATTSTLGAAISLVSVSWIVYHYTGSAIDIAYLGLTGIVPGHVMGRVLSIGDFGSFVAIPAGLVAGGLLIARYGIEFSFLVAAVGILVTGIVLLALPDFRAFGQVG